MLKTLVIALAVANTAYSKEVSSPYALLEKHTPFNPDSKAKLHDNHGVHTIKDSKPEVEHPIYRGEEIKNEGRARIEPVRPNGPVIKYDRMLADQPSDSTEVNRVDNLAIPNYGYISGPVEVAYPDIPYAPGYGYDTRYVGNSYDIYGNEANSYLMEPDTSTFGLLWSQVPNARTIVSYVSHTISWVFGSIFILLLGSFLTVSVCSYTNLCTLTFHGVGPIHEEMRSLITPERLENISTAADFVKNAIDKYQKIQTVTDVATNRRRRALFNY